MVKQCNRMLEEEGNTLFKKKMFDYKVLRNAVKNTLISGWIKTAWEIITVGRKSSFRSKG